MFSACSVQCLIWVCACYRKQKAQQQKSRGCSTGKLVHQASDGECQPTCIILQAAQRAYTSNVCAGCLPVAQLGFVIVWCLPCYTGQQQMSAADAGVVKTSTVSLRCPGKPAVCCSWQLLCTISMQWQPIQVQQMQADLTYLTARSSRCSLIV